MSPARCETTSGHSCSTPSSPAACASPRRPDTAFRSPGTTPARPVPMPTTGSRWRSWSVAESTKPRGLGRGLAALVAEFPGGGTASVEIEVDRIRPNARQPRHTFDDAALDALSESIKAAGLVQPIVVRDTGDGFEIVAGEREALILALAENVAREDLNAVELARAYAVLSDELDLSQTEIARRVGRSRPAVANTMRL